MSGDYRPDETYWRDRYTELYKDYAQAVKENRHLKKKNNNLNNCIRRMKEKHG